MINITTTYEITAHQIADLMVSVIDDGQCDEWLGMCEPRFTKHEDYSSPEAYGPDMTPRLFEVEDDDQGYLFNYHAIRNGLQIMADKFPSMFNDLREENADADTADVFMQCALFGDVVYG